MGGSSGALLAIFFSAAASALAKQGSLTEAFGHGLERMTTYGGAKPGDRTMLDALVPAIDALGGGVSAAAKAAREGANATAHLAARAGRSAYVPASTLVGVVDPGAEAVARALEAAAKALSTA
jgi:dihydroxyacetone kinase